MSKNTRYKQCELHQENLVIKGWIEARSAKVGSIVEVDDELGYWEVTEVFDHEMTSAELHVKQMMDRKGLPSIRGH